MSDGQNDRRKAIIAEEHTAGSVAFLIKERITLVNALEALQRTVELAELGVRSPEVSSAMKKAPLSSASTSARVGRISTSASLSDFFRSAALTLVVTKHRPAR